MSAGTSVRQEKGDDFLFIRWFDDPEMPTREQRVEMVELRSSESIIRSSLAIDEQTHVWLIGKDYTGNGIIQSCQAVENQYVLTIQMAPVPGVSATSSKYDPGVLVIDEFVTEEEELKILAGLSDSTG